MASIIGSRSVTCSAGRGTASIIGSRAVTCSVGRGTASIIGSRSVTCSVGRGGCCSSPRGARCAVHSVTPHPHPQPHHPLLFSCLLFSSQVRLLTTLTPPPLTPLEFFPFTAPKPLEPVPGVVSIAYRILHDGINHARLFVNLALCTLPSCVFILATPSLILILAVLLSLSLLPACRLFAGVLRAVVAQAVVLVVPPRS
jgi:hypothetical protein